MLWATGIILLFDEGIITFHQGGQSGIKVEVAQIVGDALDGFMEQSLNRFTFSCLGMLHRLDPSFIDQAPEAIEEAPDSLQIFEL